MVADGNDRLGCRQVIPLAPEFPKMTKLPTGEIRRSLRIATWEGSFGAVHANPVNSAVLTGFATDVGGERFSSVERFSSCAFWGHLISGGRGNCSALTWWIAGPTAGGRWWLC